LLLITLSILFVYSVGQARHFNTSGFKEKIAFFSLFARIEILGIRQK